MDKLKRTMMIVSMVCMAIGLCASLYFTFAIDNEQLDSTFIFFDFVFVCAIIWFAFNIKSTKKES